MKTVILFRHAKSDWNADYDGDHARPLNKRGRVAAPLMGVYLARLGQVPDLVLTSSAVRARRSVELASEAGGWTSPIEVTSDLYAASSHSILQLICALPDSADRVMLVGHQPTWSEVASALIGGGHIKLPTASMARIDFEIGSWAEVAFGSGTLAWVVTPKLLAKAGVEV